MNLSEDTWVVSQREQQALAVPSAWFSRLQAGFERISAAWVARRQRSRDAQVLQTFSDRELWDLGLGRSDISGIAAGTYRRS